MASSATPPAAHSTPPAAGPPPLRPNTEATSQLKRSAQPRSHRRRLEEIGCDLAEMEVRWRIGDGVAGP
jgi:hypothetical protein